jgi:hypothetical protein
MTHDQIKELAREAGLSFIPEANSPLVRIVQKAVELERQKHQADSERWKGEAATAEKWRGIACAKDGDGRTVQLIQQEAAAAERDRICAAIKEEDDHCADGDYMLDSDDCIAVARGEWKRPDWNVGGAA